MFYFFPRWRRALEESRRSHVDRPTELTSGSPRYRTSHLDLPARTRRADPESRRYQTSHLGLPARTRRSPKVPATSFGPGEQEPNKSRLKATRRNTKSWRRYKFDSSSFFFKQTMLVIRRWGQGAPAAPNVMVSLFLCRSGNN